MSNDLSPFRFNSCLWVEENLSNAKLILKQIEHEYKPLQNKSTSYANGLERIIKAQRKIVNVWIEA